MPDMIATARVTPSRKRGGGFLLCFFNFFDKSFQKTIIVTVLFQLFNGFGIYGAQGLTGPPPPPLAQ